MCIPKQNSPRKCPDSLVIARTNWRTCDYIQNELILSHSSVGTPPSINIEINITNRLLKTNQRLKAFNLGNIISDEHSIKGNSMLPNPPINIGIIMKSIVVKTVSLFEWTTSDLTWSRTLVDLTWSDLTVSTHTTLRKNYLLICSGCSDCNERYWLFES